MEIAIEFLEFLAHVDALRSYDSYADVISTRIPLVTTAVFILLGPPRSENIKL